MTNKVLANMIQRDDDALFLAELEKALAAELKKPAAERDYDSIAEIEKVISELRGTEAYITAASDAAAAALKQKISGHKSGRFRIRFLAPAAACMVTLITASILTFSASGTKNFSPAVEIASEDIINVYYRKPDTEEEVRYSESDIAGMSTYAQEMIEKCVEKGFTPLVPHYLPAAMESGSEWGSYGPITYNGTKYSSWEEVDFEGIQRYATFRFDDEKIRLDFDMRYNPELDEHDYAGIVAKPKELSEEEYNGHAVYFFRVRNGWLEALFWYGQVEYFIMSKGMEEAEFRKIVYSMLE